MLQLLQLSTNQQGVSMQSSCQSAGGTHCEQSRETVQHRLDLLFLYRDKAVEELQQHRHVGCASCIHSAQPEDCENKQKASAEVRGQSGCGNTLLAGEQQLTVTT